MPSRPVASDNIDGSRQDAQAKLNSPVLDSLVEEQKRAHACEQRIQHGDIFLLLHLLDEWVNVDEAVRNLQDLYLYAGFDCTNKSSTYLGDSSHRQAMIPRLQEALRVEEKRSSTAVKESHRKHGVLEMWRKRLRCASLGPTQTHPAV